MAAQAMASSLPGMWAVLNRMANLMAMAKTVTTDKNQQAMPMSEPCSSGVTLPKRGPSALGNNEPMMFEGRQCLENELSMSSTEEESTAYDELMSQP